MIALWQDEEDPPPTHPSLYQPAIKGRILAWSPQPRWRPCGLKRERDQEWEWDWSYAKVLAMVQAQLKLKCENIHITYSKPHIFSGWKQFSLFNLLIESLRTVQYGQHFIRN